MIRLITSLIFGLSLIGGVSAQQSESLSLELSVSIPPPADLDFTTFEAFWSRDGEAILVVYNMDEGVQYIPYDTQTGVADEPLTLTERLNFPLAWQAQGDDGALWALEGDKVALVEGGTLSVYLTPDQPAFTAPYVDMAAWSADGRFLAYADNRGLHVWQAETGETTINLRGMNLHRFTWNSSYPSFAVPASLGIENRSIVPYDAETGQPYEALVAPEEWAGGLRRIWWSPDGQYIFSELAYEGIDVQPPPVAWSTETGNLVDLNLLDAYDWDWHPNSRWLAYLDLDAVTVGILDIVEACVIERIHLEDRVTEARWSPDGDALFVTDEAGDIFIYNVIALDG